MHTLQLFGKRLSTPDALAIALLALALVIISLTFRAYGIAWDDPTQTRYGDLVLSFIQSGGEDQSALAFRDLKFYGAVFEAPAQFISRLLPFPVSESRHLLTALVGLLGIIGVWRFARYAGGPVAGLLALLLILAVPSYYGHAFINSKDIPFAVGYIWSLYLTLRVAQMFPRFSLPWALGLGVVLGLTLGIRVGGVLLVGYMGLLFLFHLAWRPGRAGSKSTSADLLGGVKFALAVLVPAYVVMLIFWPWALLNPISGVIAALQETVNFKYNLAVLFAGEQVEPINLPTSYWPIYLGIKLPEVMVAGLLVAIPFSIVRFAGSYRSGDRTQAMASLVLALGIFFPVVYAMVSGSVHYDAIRHFLFIIPAMAVFVAVEINALAKKLKSRKPVLAYCVYGVMVVGLILPIGHMVKLHPYQYVYYNQFVGGLPGANGRYETDYWATSYKEAAGLIANLISSEERARPPGTPPGVYRIYVCGPFRTLQPFLPPSTELVSKPAQADLFVAFTRWQCDQGIPVPAVAAVEREGVALAVIKDLRPYRKD